MWRPTIRLMSVKSHRAAVTVIGAGAIGLAAALQLRRAGVDDILVVDRDPAAGMGSSARANGGVRAEFSTAANILFSQFTITGLIELDAMTGGMVGYRPIGYLLMAGDDAA